jgi:hypothetical protein
VAVRTRRKLTIDMLQVGTMISAWFILLIFEWAFDVFAGDIGALISSLASWLLAMSACVFLILAVYGLLSLLLLLWQYFICELFLDRLVHRYKSAGVFTEYPIGSESFQREGRGINEVQNHLVSISRIKGGPIRRLSLRAVLFSVNLLARLWNNRGLLVSVPNVHFLRWVIIDNGSRLLFVDNYHGSWKGYLDAFIDGRAVKGMNAIWSHTFLEFSREYWGKVSFPRTECMMYKGARQERPFKEMVRRSQPETLVWYSAYPRLSGENITSNSEIRNAVFQNLESYELDALAQRIL